ncbi:LLM class F420-dependent oxidoreductase [Nonomuraea sp. NPDC048901]|uniref:LLM class F420-dependent oxidoreductase n=1 Tax=Nonomuraea sp. NPDC048901 TaxID=3155627 RepID=UPI003410819B
MAATERLVVATGIANIHARIPSAAETGGRILSALHPGRSVLGLGISHAGFMKHATGGTYVKQLSMMRSYLERMDAVSPAIEPGAARPARLLAAVGPKMIELSGSGADPWIVSEQAVAIGEDREDQLRRAHAHIGMYLQAPNYRNSWLRQGFDETDFVPGGSDRLVRALVGMGSAEDAAAAVTAHLYAGADHVVVQILGDTDVTDLRPYLRELAAALNLQAPAQPRPAAPKN